jgi:hypothetical protein
MLRLQDAIVYVDPHGVARGAILTTIWDGGPNPVRDAHGNVLESDSVAPCVNLVFTSGDADRRDNGGCGRQIERESSVTHMSLSSVHGRYWRRLDEAGKDTER